MIEKMHRRLEEQCSLQRILLEKLDEWLSSEMATSSGTARLMTSTDTSESSSGITTSRETARLITSTDTSESSSGITISRETAGLDTEKTPVGSKDNIYMVSSPKYLCIVTETHSQHGIHRLMERMSY